MSHGAANDGKSRYGASPTILDISRETGVSKSTISRVLTGSPRVADETRAQVLEAVERLGFRVNLAARSLRTSRSALVGLLVPAISNELFAQTAERLDEGLREHGIGLVIAGSGWDPDGDLLALDFFAARQVDAMVVATASDRNPALASRLEQLGCPVILFDREVQDTAFDVVAIEHETAIQQALAHLDELGHRRVAFCTIQTRTKANRDLVAAYRTGVRRLGLDPDRALVGQVKPSQADAGARSLDKVLPARPTAVLAAGPLGFVGSLLEQMGDLGISMPEQLSVVGYTDRRLAPLTSPRLTTIERPVEEAGRVLATMLLQRLADPDGPRMAETLPSKLFLRASCGPPR